MIKNATIYLLHSFIIWCGGFGIFTLRILYKDYCYYYEIIELFFFFVYIQKYFGVLFVCFFPLPVKMEIFISLPRKVSLITFVLVES